MAREQAHPVAGEHDDGTVAALVRQSARLVHVGRGEDVGRRAMLDALAEKPRGAEDGCRDVRGRNSRRREEIGHRAAEAARREKMQRVRGPRAR
ncbi:MAG: hypothetical protein WBQ75_02985 [Acetobacteraceae bacterium]